MNADHKKLYETYAHNVLDADGVETVNPHVRKFDNNFNVDEYLQRILYNYRKYQNSGGDLNKKKFEQAVDNIWIGTHPRALQNLHQELLKTQPDAYKPVQKDYFPYLRDWLKKEALHKVWNRYMAVKSGAENAEKQPEGELMQHMKQQGMIAKDAQVTLPKHETEEAENMSKSAFHYDPMHGLMQAANQINDILQSSYNDEARPEHIEQMALKIAGPQAEYADYHEFNKALQGVMALLNRYVVTGMN